MEKKWRKVISEMLYDIQPIQIDSYPLTLQRRNRLYWIGVRNSGGGYDGINIDKLTAELKEREITDKEIDSWVLRFINSTEENKYLKDTKTYTTALSNSNNLKNGIIYLDRFLNEDKTNNYRFINVDRKIPCVVAGYPKMGGGDPYIKDNKGIRYITPTEVEELFGLPKGYTDIGIPKGKRTQKYRYFHLGNGWVVPVIECIFKATI